MIYFGILFILVIYFVKFAIPDKGFDTLNYHLYLQISPFADNIYYNFFPARWINTFSYPLADRIHYFFRFILGYRLGNIANIYILITIYYQAKQFLKKYIHVKNKIIIPVTTFSVICTEQILMNLVSYYVDLMAIPLILEIILIILNKDINKFNNYFILFMSGIIISLKISNILILIPLGILYIIIAKKTFNWKTFVIGIPILLFPIFIYALNNYLQTRKSSVSIL